MTKSILAITAALAACTGSQGAEGPAGPPGAAGSAGAATVDQVVLPGSAFFPESIVAASDGSLFVTSLKDGAVAKIAPDHQTVTTFLPTQATQPIGRAGMLLDEPHDRFWVCQFSNDFSKPSTLDRYNLATGAFEESHALADPAAACNDIASDAAGNLYVTDSFLGIERLPASAAATDPLHLWATGAAYQPATVGAFAVNGIAIDGANVYTDNLDRGILARTPISPDGSAGTAVEIAGVTLTACDGMRWAAPNTLLVAEGEGALSKIVIDPAHDTGVRDVVSNRIDRPSAVAVTDGAAWVTEGQIRRMFGLDPTPTSVPFLVQRVELFDDKR